MQNLIRRSSGVYVFRLSVPRRLRHVIGKREVIVSTGTRELSVAKIVAASLASQWLQQFFESDRLLSATNTSTMPHDDLLKIAHGHPTLLTGSTLKMTHAASVAGLTTSDLLQAAADGKLERFIRAVQLPGYLLPEERLEPVDAAMGLKGGIAVPHPDQMPTDAMRHFGAGLLRLFPLEVA